VTPYVVFTFGLAFLLGAGHLVIGSSTRIGTYFGLSPMVVGLTVVAAGTSAPELAVVGQAIAADDTELAVGSIIGSNIANVLLVLGIAALMGAITVTSRVVRIDIPVMIAASVGVLVLSLDNRLTRIDGILLSGALLVFVIWTIQSTRSPHTPKVASAAPAGDGERVASTPEPPSLLETVAGFVLGIGGLVVAARFVVSGARTSQRRWACPS
jgi:cation:H+ antiporter